VASIVMVFSENLHRDVDDDVQQLTRHGGSHAHTLELCVGGLSQRLSACESEVQASRPRPCCAVALTSTLTPSRPSQPVKALAHPPG